MKIHGLDRNKSSNESGIAKRYFTLSGNVSPTWNALFYEYFENYHSTNKRKVHLEKNTIVVECGLDEIQTQLDLLQAACAEIDKRYQRHIEQEQAQRVAYEDAEKEKRKAADEAYKNLKF